MKDNAHAELLATRPEPQDCRNREPHHQHWQTLTLRQRSGTVAMLLSTSAPCSCPRPGAHILRKACTGSSATSGPVWPEDQCWPRPLVATFVSKERAPLKASRKLKPKRVPRQRFHRHSQSNKPYSHLRLAAHDLQ